MALSVLHLIGSTSTPELDELSRLYARDCLAAVEDRSRYEPVIAHVSPDGAWRFPSHASSASIAEAPTLSVTQAIVAIDQLAVDVMVPHMFCLAGMTRLRALFDTLGIPWVGNPPEAMALTARKDLARAIVAAAGVRVPAGAVVSHGGDLGAVSALGWPVVVKPVDADNSAGVSLVRESEGYAGAVARACEHGSAALVEAFVAPGREVRCGLLERDGELLGLPLEEYPVDEHRPVRRAADKLAHDEAGELALVAKGGSRAWIVDPSDPVCEPVWAAARSCHAALGCRHYSLFDFRIDTSGHPWFLEAGLYCSFAPNSVVATMAAAGGLALPELFAHCVEAAMGARQTHHLSTP